ncbi:hypothetical protein Hanom_Chr17g01550291 [Helianthus anomalus]
MKPPSFNYLTYSVKNSKDLPLYFSSQNHHPFPYHLRLNPNQRPTMFSSPVFSFFSVFDFCLIPSALFMRFDVWFGLSDG